MDHLELVKRAFESLEAAPVKWRIDFAPYWDWYEQSCIPTMELLRKAIFEVQNGKQTAVHTGDRPRSGSNDGAVGDGNSSSIAGARAESGAGKPGKGESKVNVNPNAGLERI